MNQPKWVPGIADTYHCDYCQKFLHHAYYQEDKHMAMCGDCHDAWVAWEVNSDIYDVYYKNLGYGGMSFEEFLNSTKPA